MHKSAEAKKKRVLFHKHFGALLWRERRTCFYSALAGVLLSIVALILLKRKILALTIALLAGLGHGCQGMLDSLKELH